MDRVRDIEPAAWMTIPETRRVVAALQAKGSRIRFIGGCVRDTLLGRPVTDIDIATPDPPEQVTMLLHDAGVHSIPTGIAHGTITAVEGAHHYEITTLRVDVKTHGRHADVAFTDDWEEDAARRDFTMNALSLSPDGALYDPWGGIADLKAGRVRFVGEAARRIEEDHLRLLRFFRFHAWYGKGAPDAEGLAACKAWATSLRKLSGERLRDETLKLLGAPQPVPVVGLMIEAGVMRELLPEADGTALLAALIKIEPKGEHDPLRRLAALLRGAETKPVAERLRLSNKDAERLAAMAKPPADILALADRQAQRRALYQIGAGLFRDLVLLARAEHGKPRTFRAMLRAADDWRAPELPVRGADVLALGIPEGAAVGDLLCRVEAWWIERDFAPSREEALDRLKSLASTRSSPT